MEIDTIAKEKYLYLTTIGRRTGNPHTVELWFAVAKGKVYLSHEGQHTDWMKNLLKENHVKFRVGNSRLQGKAQIFHDGNEFEIGKYALYIKYYGEATKETIDDWFSESTVVEIILEQQSYFQ